MTGVGRDGEGGRGAKGKGGVGEGDAREGGAEDGGVGVGVWPCPEEVGCSMSYEQQNTRKGAEKFCCSVRRSKHKSLLV